MSVAVISCPQCHAVLPEATFNQTSLTPCPGCGAPVRAEVFPAFFRKLGPGSAGEVVMLDGEASCFYHPRKKAVLSCDGCGRFLCGLCDCPLEGRHYCPACLESGKSKRKIKTLDNHRTLYDSIALALAVYPLIIFYLTIVTAPMSLFVAIRYWKAPLSLVRRHRVRSILAILISLVEIGAWVTFFGFLATHRWGVEPPHIKHD